MRRKNSLKSQNSNSISSDTTRLPSHSVPSLQITRRLPNKHMETRHRKSFKPSCSPNYQFSFKMNWQSLENTTPVSRTLKRSFRGDASMHSCYQINNSSNHSTKLSRRKKSRPSQLSRNKTQTSDHLSRRNFMAIADTVQFTGTNGPSAANDYETKQRATTTHKRRKNPNNKTTTTQRHKQNTTPNWSAKFAGIQATPQKTAAIESPKFQRMEVCPTIDKPQPRIGTSDVTSEEHKTAPTQPMK